MHCTTYVSHRPIAKQQEADMEISHEAGPTGDHYVLAFRQRLELGRPSQHRGVLPDAIILVESEWTTIAMAVAGSG